MTNHNNASSTSLSADQTPESNPWLVNNDAENQSLEPNPWLVNNDAENQSLEPNPWLDNNDVESQISESNPWLDNGTESQSLELDRHTNLLNNFNPLMEESQTANQSDEPTANSTEIEIRQLDQIQYESDDTSVRLDNADKDVLDNTPRNDTATNVNVTSNQVSEQKESPYIGWDKDPDAFRYYQYFCMEMEQIREQNELRIESIVNELGLEQVDNINGDDTDNFFARIHNSKKVFNYIVENNQYDISQMERKISYFSNETYERDLHMALVEKKGVCSSFAAEMSEILKRVGVNASMVIVAKKEYIDGQEQVIDNHAAVIAEITDDKYAIYDPTFGLGMPDALNEKGESVFAGININRYYELTGGYRPLYTMSVDEEGGADIHSLPELAGSSPESQKITDEWADESIQRHYNKKLEKRRMLELPKADKMEDNNSK